MRRWWFWTRVPTGRSGRECSEAVVFVPMVHSVPVLHAKNDQAHLTWTPSAKGEWRRRGHAEGAWSNRSRTQTPPFN